MSLTDAAFERLNHMPDRLVPGKFLSGNCQIETKSSYALPGYMRDDIGSRLIALFSGQYGNATMNGYAVAEIIREELKRHG